MKRIIKKILPDSVKRELQRCHSYGRKELALYFEIRFINGVQRLRTRSLAPARIAALSQSRSVLFVCYGNIMRSPMCEALMRKACAGHGNSAFAVTSAGTHATPGTAAHPWAVAAAREYGISLEHHQSRLLTDQTIAQADLIFVMDYQNQVDLALRWPSVKNKTFLLSTFAAEHFRMAEIADPYSLGEEATRECFRILDSCIRNLVTAAIST